MNLLNCKIDYTLFTDNKIEIKKKNVDANYTPLNSIVFEENTIDLQEKIYTRKTDELELIINIKTQKCTIKYDSYNSLSFDIDASLTAKHDTITLNYNLGEENKKLVISMKEVKL